MARETLGRRIWLTLKFIVCYFVVLIFSDLPRVACGRKKKIENQIVVITGGAMGIGKAVAHKLAVDHKAKVVIFDVNEKEGMKTVHEIKDAGGYCTFMRCDISNTDDLEKCRDYIYNDPNLGKVDILMCNAAVLKFGELTDLSYRDYEINSKVNILGHIFCVKVFLPEMIQRKSGHIVSIGSICSHYGEYYGTAYCTAKFACRGFMEALKMELLEKGLDMIELTSIYPYFVQTSLITNNMEEPFSTYWNVVSVERVANEIVESILKNRMMHFIPGGLLYLCVYCKCLVTKGVLAYGRRVFNFTYRPKPKDNDSQTSEDFKFRDNMHFQQIMEYPDVKVIHDSNTYSFREKPTEIPKSPSGF